MPLIKRLRQFQLLSLSEGFSILEMKSLVSPLLLIYLFLAVVLGAWAFARRREAAGSLRSWVVMGGAFIVSVWLYLPATWIGSEWLRSTLVPKTQEGFSERYPDWQPDWIVVLAGGMVRGASPEENVLSAESALRVARAVTLARLYPEAGLIFSGGLGDVAGDRGQVAGGRGQGTGDRMQVASGSVVQLMQELALARGVDLERCRLEMASTKTMEHPKGVLALEGVWASDRLLVVSSDWHLPRVRMVFDLVFANIRYEGSSMRLRSGPLWKRLIPNEEALAASALYLREWVGRGWYIFKVESGKLKAESDSER